VRQLPILTVALASLAAGCGADRVSPPPSFLPPDEGLNTVRFAKAGMRVGAPAGATVDERTAPGVFRMSYADWFISGFAYRRREQLPRSSRELRAARTRLVREVRRRDRSYRLVGARLTRAAGAPAIELVGDQVLSKSRLRTRSVHVYKGRAEYVLEMVAPARSFDLLDDTFDRVAASLRVSGRVQRRS
jgi:hypothetical protein